MCYQSFFYEVFVFILMCLVYVFLWQYQSFRYLIYFELIFVQDERYIDLSFVYFYKNGQFFSIICCRDGKDMILFCLFVFFRYLGIVQRVFLFLVLWFYFQRFFSMYIFVQEYFFFCRRICSIVLCFYYLLMIYLLEYIRSYIIELVLFLG